MVDFFARFPGDAFRNGDILGERAVAVYSQYLHIATDMGLTGAALVTVTTGDMRFCSYKITRNKLCDLAADFDDFTGKFVAEDTRGLHAMLRPRVPIIDMHVCAADGSGFHLHQHITRANLRYIYQGNRCSRRRLGFEGRLHFSVHSIQVLQDY